MFSFHELSTVNYTRTKTMSDSSSRAIASSLGMYLYFSAEPGGTSRVTEGSYVRQSLMTVAPDCNAWKCFEQFVQHSIAVSFQFHANVLAAGSE